MTSKFSSTVHGSPRVRESLLRTRLDAARHLHRALLVMGVAYLVFYIAIDVFR